MSESSKLKQKMDLVSYMIAGVLSLVILSIPALSGDKASKEKLTVQENIKALDDQIIKADSKPIPPTRPWSTDLLELWDVTSSGQKVSWITENKPASLRLWNDVPAPIAVHESGGVVSIELVRDAEKKNASLRVTGKLSSRNQHVEIEEIVLERKVGEEEFKAVEGFEEVSDFVYEDADVQAGKTYSYRFSTVAVPGQVKEGLPAPILNLDAKTKNSNELATEVAVPMDLVVKITRYSDEQIDPKLIGQILYWDYVKAAKVSLRSRSQEDAWEKGFAFGEDHKGKPRFSIRRIVPEPEHKYHGVTIEDFLSGDRVTFKKVSKDFPSIESWDTVEAPFEVPDKPEESEEPEAAGTKKPAGKPVVKKPASKPTSTVNEKTSGSKAKPSSGASKGRPGGKRSGKGFE